MRGMSCRRRSVATLLFLTLGQEAFARAIISSMKETLPRGRGEAIPLREYQTRIGGTVEEVTAIISAIEGALAQ